MMFRYALLFFVVSTATSCNGLDTVDEIRRQDGWVLGGIVPFRGVELLVISNYEDPWRIAFLECTADESCRLLSIDSLDGVGVGSSVPFYPTNDGIVVGAADRIYYYRPAEDELISYQVALGGVIYVVDDVLHSETGLYGGRRYDLRTGEFIEDYEFEAYRLAPVFESPEEARLYRAGSPTFTEEARRHYEELLDLDPR